MVLAALAALGAGWRPSKRLLATSLAAPLVSVSILAWLYGNPFNGTVFVVLAATLAALGQSQPTGYVRRAPPPAAVLGAAIAAFGFFYPHFLAGGSAIDYLYAAPTGLVPCPTLSLAVGVALVADGFGALAWPLVLAVAGLSYGIFGVLRLGVLLDLGLILGAAGLLVQTLARFRK